MHNINPSSIALAIITHYPNWYEGKHRIIKNTDKIRGDLALQFLKKASIIGYQIVVADGKSSRSFHKELIQISGIIIVKRNILNRSLTKKRAIRKAAKLSNVKVIITTEAEKVSLLEFIPQIVKPLFENKAHIIVPKRELKLFADSYPQYQFESETEGNRLYNEILQSEGLVQKNDEFDFFFGPRAFVNTPQVRSLFTRKYHQYFTDYSAVQFFPLIMALKKKKKIATVTINFSYPKTQKANEETGERALFLKKRTEQLTGILNDLTRFLNLPKQR